MTKKMNTRHLIVDLFLGAASTQLTIKQLLIGAKIFNISENGVRVAVNRLVNEGKLECVERGIYQLSSEAQHWARLMLNRRNGIKQTKIWQNDFLMVLTGTLGRIDRTALKKRERALHQFGFRELEMGVYIRPNNLAQSIETTFKELIFAGLEAQAKICKVEDFDAHSAQLIQQLWDTEDLNQTYIRLSDKILSWLNHYTELSLQQAAYDSFWLGRETISLLMQDPLLPGPFVDEYARTTFADVVQQLDKIGLMTWEKVYQMHDSHLFE